MKIDKEEKQYVYDKLTNIKNRVEDADYEIYADFKDFSDYVELGTTPKEKLQIFIMLYVASPTLNELENWTLRHLIDYIKETDEYYNEDLIYINDCKNLIKIQENSLQYIQKCEQKIKNAKTTDKMKEIVKEMYKNDALSDIDFSDIIYNNVIPKLCKLGVEIPIYIEETSETAFDLVIQEKY